MKKKSGKNNGGSVMIRGIKNGFLGALCTLAVSCAVSLIIKSHDDPVSLVYPLSLICCGAGGFVCALTSFINCKSDVLLCSLVSGAALCVITSLGSLIFDNTGKDALSRFLPMIVIIVSSVSFGLLFSISSGKKRRRIRP